MARVTEQEAWDAIFGSGCMEEYSWWIDYRVVEGPLDDDYNAPDGWVRKVIVEDPDNEDGAITKNVDAKILRKACMAIMHDMSFRKSLRDECAHFCYDADELDFDAVDADTVLQYIMFDSEIVYG